MIILHGLLESLYSSLSFTKAGAGGWGGGGRWEMISVCISDFAVSNNFFVSGKEEEIENHLASLKYVDTNLGRIKQQNFMEWPSLFIYGH